MDKRVRIQQKEIFRTLLRLQPIVDDKVISPGESPVGGNRSQFNPRTPPVPVDYISQALFGVSARSVFAYGHFRAGNPRNFWH
jgi:hypothetical protein